MTAITYVIIGWDIEDYKEITDVLELDSDLYEEFTCNQIEGEIQLFTDPMSGEYCRFGYIVGAVDHYGHVELKSFPLYDYSDLIRSARNMWKSNFDSRRVSGEPSMLIFTEYS